MVLGSLASIDVWLEDIHWWVHVGHDHDDDFVDEKIRVVAVHVDDALTLGGRLPKSNQLVRGKVICLCYILFGRTRCFVDGVSA